MPRGMCRQLIQATAPRQFTQHARNPARSVPIGGPHTVFAPAYGSPFIHNLDEGRRYARIEDFRNFVKLAYQSKSLHHSGGTICEPVDLPVNKRHFDMVYSHMKYSDKCFMGSVTHPERAKDTVEMAKILFGDAWIDPATGRPKTFIVSLINVNSPMTYDATMLGALKVYARANQACIVTPFILAGAMSPVTVAGTATQTLAEALAGMAFIQLLNPGCPMVLGSFASSLSMQSGAPTFGTPEPALVLYVMATLARRLGVPFRSGGSLCALEDPGRAGRLRVGADAAADLPRRRQLRAAHDRLARGRARDGLREVRDGRGPGGDDAHAARRRGPLRERPGAVSAIREVGPGKHFLGCAHTLANFETAFYRSPLADNNSYEQWEAEGRKDMAVRANERWKKQLEEYVAPPLDAAVDEALLDYMNRRKAAFPDSNV